MARFGDGSGMGRNQAAAEAALSGAAAGGSGYLGYQAYKVHGSTKAKRIALKRLKALKSTRNKYAAGAAGLAALSVVAGSHRDWKRNPAPRPAKGSLLQQPVEKPAVGAHLFAADRKRAERAAALEAGSKRLTPEMKAKLKEANPWMYED